MNPGEPKPLEIYGTLGPNCHQSDLLADMIAAGMTGVRFNLSHGTLKEAEDWINSWKDACAFFPEPKDLLIDLQGRELRIGKIHPLPLVTGDFTTLMEEIPLEEEVYEQLHQGDILLLDDGKIMLEVLEKPLCSVLIGGTLTSRKNMKIKGRELELPPLRKEDLENLAVAKEMGVTAVMVPFVERRQDLEEIRQILDELQLEIKVYAKIENMEGVRHLEEFADLCDEVVIARGDLGSSVGIPALPGIQRDLEKRCTALGVPYMVVTEMLASMISSPVCTRAEANDVYYAVLNGASAIMLTGETASGKFPLEAMKTFVQLANAAQSELAL